jgi:serine/threonine protein kinase
MAPEWYIDAGGQVEGPFTPTELGVRAAIGGLAPTDSISSDRVTWVPANTLAWLSFPDRPRRPLLETVVSGSVSEALSGTDDGPAVVPVVSVPGYQILDTLGAGACGVVYKALQEKLNRVVALKTILMPDRASAELLNRFKREAVSLARVQHPNIVAVYDSGMCATPVGQAFFAMELLAGEDLSVRLNREGPMDERTVWLIARQAAAALAHAAKNGIVHRDVKPANLFLVPPPTGFPLPPDVPMVKVTDFGLALSRAEGDQRQSVAGTLVGTPVYMAPEQFSDGDIDARTDVYGLGCTVYHALAGAPPFDGRTVWDVMMKKSAPAPRLPAPVAAETADLVASMLAIRADDRPGTYDDLLARIDALPCMEPGQCSVRLPPGSVRLPAVPVSTVAQVTEPPAAPAPAPPPDSPPGPRRRWVYVLAAVALVGLGVGLGALTGAFNRSAGPAPGTDSAADRSGSTDPVPKPSAPSDGPGRAVSLLNPRDALLKWQVLGGAGKFVTDDNGESVLEVPRGAARRFEKLPPPNFRVALGIDPREARTVEVIVATDAPASTRWVVLLDKGDKGTAVFGKRVGAGPIQPVGTAVHIPTPEELTSASKRSYLTVGYERIGGALIAWFNAQELGRTGAAGLTMTEMRAESSGPIRIDQADLTELHERK